MSKLKVQTTQNVPLDFEVANTGLRLLAALIDTLVIVVYWIGIYYLLSALGHGDVNSGVMSIMFYLLLIIPSTFYGPILEFLWSGQTVGKWMLKCRVVKVDGSRLSLGSIIIRSLLRNIDSHLFLLVLILMGLGVKIQIEVLYVFYLIPAPIVGLISMGMSKHTQRLGDLAAGTAVVRLKRALSLKDTIFRVVKTDYEPVFKNVLLLSDRDIRIIKNTLEDYDRTKDATKVKILGEKARVLLGVEKKVEPLPMLRTIIRDYNVMANQEGN